MNLLISSVFYFFVFQLSLPPTTCQTPEEIQQQQEFAAEKTRAIAHIFSLIQCFPEGIDNDVLGSSHTLPVPEILSSQTNQSFHPEHHIEEYANTTEIQNLLAYVAKIKASGAPDNTPFTTNPQNLQNFQVVLVVLWRNAENWSLFFSTAAWLVGRANSAILFWSLMIVCAEKFTDITVPSTVEIFPQLYLPKEYVLSVVELEPKKIWVSDNPLYYWMTDPGLNEFHTHFHMDMPFWWDGNYFGVIRDRKGELFLYMHHQIINRYNAERFSHWLPEVTPLEIDANYYIPEGYAADIVDVDFREFPSRPDWWKMGSFDDGPTTLASLNTMLGRLLQAIQLGYFVNTQNRPIWLNGTNGADIVGATVESSNVYSANYAFYGIFHNLIHSYLSGQLRAKADPIPGVEAHQETAMRDRVFYQIHKRVDLIYILFKSQVLLSPPYTKAELEFSGITMLDLKVLTCPPTSSVSTWLDAVSHLNLNWPFTWQKPGTPVLTTYMTKSTYDISNAARPCLSIDDPPRLVQIPIINHFPFTFLITVQSTRPTVAYGMVRIFLWPERQIDGVPLEGDEAHMRAIELDRFRIRIDPGKAKVIKRSSLESSLTKVGTSPGIKELYNIEAGDELLTNPRNRRACGFPNNMLIPRGTAEGMPYILTVYISDETDSGEIDENVYSREHYPYCGALNGVPFPDKRSMGFPFDRPGTNFNVNITSTPLSTLLGCNNVMMANIKQTRVIIKHVGQQEVPFM